MPVTVNLFLQQVKKRLWDDTSFYLNAEHVMLVRPVSWDMKRDKADDFGDLAHVGFQEYSENMPHEQYTLGLGGKPAGPDFYINKMDNTMSHGPKSNGAEPCFAKIIIGKDTFDIMMNMPMNKQHPLSFEKPIEVVNVRLFRDLKGVHGGPEYIAAQAANTQQTVAP